MSRQSALRRSAVDLVDRAGVLQQVLQRARRGRRPTARNPSRRSSGRGVAAERAVERRGRRCLRADARRPRPRRSSPSRAPWRPAASSSVEAAHGQRRLGLGGGQHLEGDVGQHGQRAPGAGHQLGQVVAGDVLHHPAAGLERLAAAGHGVDAEHVVARRTRLQAARAGRDWRRARRRSCRLAAGALAEQRAVVHRLEGELLAVLAPAAPRSRRAACRPWPTAPVPPARRA